MAESAHARRFSAGVVVVHLGEAAVQYLLLRAYKNWDFPKGLVEPGEGPLDAAVREVKEETTLDNLSFDWGLDYIDTGPYNKGRFPVTTSRAATTLGCICRSIRSLGFQNTRRRAGSDLKPRSTWSRRGSNR